MSLKNEDRKDHTFRWAGGIEDTFILDPHPCTGRTLDEYELAGHYGRWREDIVLADSLGLSSLRWGIPWYLVEPQPGVFSWDWTDRVIDTIGETTGIGIILDLIHYGTPAWLEKSVLSPDFSRRAAEYAGRALERYHGRIEAVTPLNEPYVHALYCGERGEWPPYATGETGFFRCMKHIAAAIIEITDIARELSCEVIQVEAGAKFANPEQGGYLNAKTLLSWDLLAGNVNEAHILFASLTESGWSDGDFDFFRSRDGSALPDILGLNYYPQWSVTGATGEALYGGTEYLELLIREWSSRYGRPVMITETSFRGDAAEQSRWLKESSASALKLEECCGYTWFPLLNMIDWEYRNSDRPMEEFILPLGLWNLDRRTNAAAEVYRNLIGGQA